MSLIGKIGKIGKLEAYCDTSATDSHLQSGVLQEDVEVRTVKRADTVYEDTVCRAREEGAPHHKIFSVTQTLRLGMNGSFSHLSLSQGIPDFGGQNEAI